MERFELNQKMYGYYNLEWNKKNLRGNLKTNILALGILVIVNESGHFEFVVCSFFVTFSMGIGIFMKTGLIRIFLPFFLQNIFRQCFYWASTFVFLPE